MHETVIPVAPEAGEVWRWGRSALTARIVDRDDLTVTIRSADRPGARTHIWGIAAFLGEWARVTPADGDARHGGEAPGPGPGAHQLRLSAGELAELAREAADANLCGERLPASTAVQVLSLVEEINHHRAAASWAGPLA